MKAQYELKFQSEAQRDAFEELLLSMQVPFREVEANLAEAPEAEYRSVDPKLLEINEQDIIAIRKATEDFDKGEFVEGEDVRTRLQDRIDSLKHEV